MFTRLAAHLFMHGQARAIIRAVNRYSYIAGVFAVLAAGWAGSAEPGAVSYTEDIHPVLADRCYRCHGEDKRRGGFSMNSRESFLAGGELGPALVLGNSDKSLLIELVTSDDPEARMPPKGDRLTPEQIALLAAWIDAGLPWDAPETAEPGWTVPLGPRDVGVPSVTGIYDSEHPVDRFVAEYFEDDDYEPPSLVDDRRFVRRAYLDIVGLLPEPETVEAFAASRKRDKHARLVDALLADRRSYAEHWMTFWNDALRNDFRGTGYIDGGRKQITGWLYSALEENRPYDEFVGELIAPDRRSEGFINGIVWRGASAANQQVPLQAARNVSQVFLGVNLKCASCHDSFVDDWKLADAYGLASAFSEEPLELVRCDSPTGQIAETKFLWPELGAIPADASLNARRERVAELVTSRENGRFARTIVNRIWADLMGRGLVEPLTSLAAEPWDADLLDWLANTFVDSGYDVQALIRLIVTSRTYRLESDPAADTKEDYVFRGPLVKRLTAEQFYDALSCVTGVWQSESEYTPKPDRDSLSQDTVRAWRVPADPLTRALGRPNREQVILARETEYTRLQALELTNGDTLAAFIARGADALLSEGGPLDSEALFARAIGRPPAAEERDVLREYGEGLTERSDVEDVLWLLAMHPEFQLIF